MDQRKLESFKRHAEDEEELNIHRLINSTKMNEALVENAATMFELEFLLRQKAQLKYLQRKMKNESVSKIMNMLNHQFLWQPTPLFYIATAFGFLLAKNRYRLQPITFLPFLMIPATLDYLKRDYYIKLEKKDYDEFKRATTVVRQILGEKKQYVTLEQVLTFCFHLNMDNQIDQRRLLPISFL